MKVVFARSFLFTLGLMVIFLGLEVSYHRAFEEGGAKILADHSLDFCLNWAIGVATGAFSVGILWWFRESWRK